MPLTGDAKREYQRQAMAKRRAKTGETKTNGHTEPGETIIPPGKHRPFDEIRRSPRRTNKTGDGVPAGPPDPSHEHYWLRTLGDDNAVCTQFEMQGRLVGGCGEIRPYSGKLLPTSDDHPDLATAIIDSDQFKEIQSKMPVTKAREQR